MHSDRHETFSQHIIEGLNSNPKILSSQYFYDDRGSQLFEKLMDQPAYYLYDSEREIFQSHSAEIGRYFPGQDFNLIELGAGDGRKTKYLLKQLLEQEHQFTYYPVDISAQALADLSKLLHTDLPDVRYQGKQLEYFEALNWIDKSLESPIVVLFIGSNFGNFIPSTRHQFLEQLTHSLSPGDSVLIGFDLKKDIEILLKAYNDPAGVTAQFNLNLLKRINREFDGDFNVDQFRHYGTYNPNIGAIESFILSTTSQTVTLKKLNRTFDFEPWEPIHTEYSYKYNKPDIYRLAKQYGFSVQAFFFDEKQYFADVLWQKKQ